MRGVLEPRFGPFPIGPAFDRGRPRILAFDPVARATRAVGRVEPLRHDALEAELAGMTEYHVARFARRAIASAYTIKA
jgi:hypothetical protein